LDQPGRLTGAFGRSLNIVLSLEGDGAVTNDPHDPGGVTRWGISKRAYPMIDVEGLTFDEAAGIYRRDYWDKVGCEEFPEPVALVLFDAAVNQGPGPAIRLLQAALGVHVDGIVGHTTLAAARDQPTVGTLSGFISRRWDRYYDTGGAGVYLRGWTHRLLRIQAEAMWLAGAREAHTS
jgi:lysozyme family protein